MADLGYGVCVESHAIKYLVFGGHEGSDLVFSRIRVIPTFAAAVWRDGV